MNGYSFNRGSFDTRRFGWLEDAWRVDDDDDDSARLIKSVIIIIPINRDDAAARAYE